MSMCSFRCLLFPTVLLIALLCNSIKVEAQATVDLSFYDTCNGKVIRHWYSLVSNHLSKESFREYLGEKENGFRLSGVTSGLYSLGFQFNHPLSKFGVSYLTSLEIGNGDLVDTLEIPRIGQLAEAVDANTIFVCCDTVCNGEQEYYNSKGTLQIKGSFVNGVAHEIAFYDKAGTLSRKSFYKSGEVAPYKSELYYNGILGVVILTERLNRRKVKESSFDPDGNLLHSLTYKLHQNGPPVHF